MNKHQATRMYRTAEIVCQLVMVPRHLPSPPKTYWLPGVSEQNVRELMVGGNQITSLDVGTHHD